MWSWLSITFALLGALAVVVFGPSCTLVMNGRSSDVSIAGWCGWSSPTSFLWALWAESEVGKFHRRISVIMFLAATIVCAVCLLLSAGKRGIGFFVIAQVASLDFLIREIPTILESPVPAVGKTGPASHRFGEETLTF